MRHLSRALPRAVENAEVLRAARAGAVLRRWDEAVGPVLAAKSAPDRYDKGTVWVATQGSAWAQELRLMKPLILERLERMAGERGMFLDVRFGVRPPKGPLAGGDEAREASLPSPHPTVAPVSATPTPKEHAPLPAVFGEDAPRPSDDVGLSIRERAARRLANWPTGDAEPLFPPGERGRGEG